MTGVRFIPSLKSGVFSTPVPQQDKCYRFRESYMYTERYCFVLSSWGGLALSLMRGVSGKDAVKAFVMAGGVVRQGKGDHVNIKMPNGQLITIPVSGDLKIGLLKSAIRKAGLDDKDFLKLLKGEEGGFWSEVPTLPGCYSQGETIDETLRNTKEAIEVHLLVLKEDLVAAPVEESLFIGRVQVEVA
jgi:predicted RNase H-like HicB family nuclease/predicted RNA binding protein YcfA (HicA-like mRNA interferase family)